MSRRVQLLMGWTDSTCQKLPLSNESGYSVFVVGESGTASKLRSFHARYEEARPERAKSALAQVLFFVSFGVWLAAGILWISCFASFITQYMPLKEAKQCYVYVRFGCLAMLALRELMYGRHDRQSLAALIGAAFMAAIAFPLSSAYLFDGVWFVYAARDIPFRRIARFAMVEMVAVVSIVVISSIMGIVDDVVTGEGSLRGARHALGFMSPNTAPAFSVFVFCLWAYVRGERFGLVDSCGVLAIECGLYCLTFSRTALVLTIVLVAIMLLYRFLPPLWLARFKRYAGKTMIGSAIGAAVLSILLCSFYQPDIAWMAVLNDCLSNRIAYGHDALEQFGVALFGQNPSLGVVSNYNRFTGAMNTDGPRVIVDNLYIRLLVFCGPIFLALGLAIATASFAELYKRDDVRTLLILAIPVLYSFMEVISCNLFFNPFLFLLAIPFAWHSKEEGH